MGNPVLECPVVVLREVLHTLHVHGTVGTVGTPVEFRLIGQTRCCLDGIGEFLRRLEDAIDTNGLEIVTNLRDYLVVPTEGCSVDPGVLELEAVVLATNNCRINLD